MKFRKKQRGEEDRNVYWKRNYEKTVKVQPRVFEWGVSHKKKGPEGRRPRMGSKPRIPDPRRQRTLDAKTFPPSFRSDKGGGK